MKAPVPENEHQRLDALRRHRILDTPPEQHLDDITRLAAFICGTPTALITLVDAERQWFKSRVGWAVPETSRDVSFCAHAILQAGGGELVVADALRDERFADNPLVLGDPHIRFYAGLPLLTPKGHALGTLCVIDRVPRVLQPAQLTALRALRRAVTTEFELRRGQDVAGIVESMGDGFVMLDRQWRYTYVNARASELLGRSPDLLIGRNYHEEYPEAAGTPFERAYRKAMQEQVAVVIEERYSPWDRWFENRVFPTPEGIAIFFREITERKTLEGRLADEQAKLRRLIDGLGSGMFVGLMTPDGTLIEANAPALFAAGLRPGDALGRPVDQTYWFAHSAAEQHRLRAAIARAAAGESSLYDVQIQVREGELLWIEFSLQPLRDARGEIAYLVPSGVDIGKRKRAEQDLRDSTARLELAAQSGNVGLWDWDLRTDRVFYSPEWKRQIGYEPHEIADAFSEWRSRVHPDDLAGALQRVEAFIEKPLPSHQIEFRLRHKDGSYRWILSQGALLRDTAGKPVRMLGSHVDVTERKLAEAAIRERERQLSTLMASLPGMAYRCRNDADYTIEFVSDGIAELTGYPASDFREHRRQYGPMIHPQDQQPVWEEIQAALGAKRPFELTYRLQTANGQRWVWERGQGIHDAGGKLLALEGFVTDITERKRAEQGLVESEARFRRLAESSPDAVLIHVDQKISFANHAMVDLMRARDETELLGKPSTFMLAPEVAEAALQRTRALYAGESQPRAEQTYIRLDGTPVDVEIAAAPLTLDGRPAAHVTVRDITERKRNESRIEYLATHDGLTDLPNRNLIHDRITQAISHARRTERQIAVMYVDLDRFKVVNDGFGHPFGDEVLKAAGARLAGIVRDGDTVARQGGDEFLVLLADLRKSTDVYIVAQKVLEAFEQPFMLLGREIHLTASIGVSLFPQDGQTADALIGNADVAMYRAKEAGRNAYQFFTREMSDETQRRVEIETELRSAVAKGQLRLAYQPLVDLGSGRMTGCEALLRWDHPTLGAVPPARFIPIAEDSGLIVPVGDWVLRTACAQNRAWQDAGLPPLVMSVNLSARQFLQQDVVGWVLDVLAQSGLPAERLELELTESLIAQDVEKFIVMVNRLKQAGVRLAIDDFGTGYSSLSYLKRFRVDTLKIDQSFVRNLTSDVDDATIALAVIALAHNLRMTAVAEGVETADQYTFLRLNRCDAIQGYLFSKPVPAADLEAMLRSGKSLQD
jgi:diguanylate cyclase (GGDEF)-like protein/PAS domain S-box-containing protein